MVVIVVNKKGFNSPNRELEVEGAEEEEEEEEEAEYKLKRE
jgi:hypothetical protein